jgi:integrase
MPAHKIQRQEEISVENWQKILALSEQLDYSKAEQVPPFQFWLTCVLAIVWLTGKRINEILSLKRNTITFTKTEIRIKFKVGKKQSRGAPLELQPYQKARTIEHKAVPYIQKYLKEFDKKTLPPQEAKKAFLFPANTAQRIRIVKTKFTNGQSEEETRQYTYTDPGGYIYEENARYYLNKINQQLPEDERIYFHYGRHSIGIKQAYQGKTPYQIAEVLDESVRAALEYTKHAGGYSSEWTMETE